MKRLINVIIILMTAAGCSATERTKAKILSSGVICKQENRYIGWATVARTSSGELLAVFSGDRDHHVCPFGKVHMVRSKDSGKTWSEPVVLTNTPLDDRDSGILVTKKGTIIVSWFTSLYYENLKPKNEEIKFYKRHSSKIDAKTRKLWLGGWVIRSTDGGKTWSEPIRTPSDSPHGPIELHDGRLLHVTLGGVAESTDDGLSWHTISAIPYDKSKGEYLCEVHAVETEPNRVVALSRYENGKDLYERQSVSEDGGRTWSPIVKTNIYGLPAHLIKLQNGWLLATYGRRVAPQGERACISKDGGRTWETDNEFEICRAIPQKGGDLGYPASAQLDDGSIYTVFYQVEKDGEKPCLMGVHWKLD